jgi:hypothetical protein
VSDTPTSGWVFLIGFGSLTQTQNRRRPSRKLTQPQPKPESETHMLEKIQSYFGLTTMPFGRTLAPGMLFCSGDHNQAVARIGYGIGARGITVITGEVGPGSHC